MTSTQRFLVKADQPFTSAPRNFSQFLCTEQLPTVGCLGVSPHRMLTSGPSTVFPWDLFSLWEKCPIFVLEFTGLIQNS